MRMCDLLFWGKGGRKWAKVIRYKGIGPSFSRGGQAISAPERLPSPGENPEEANLEEDQVCCGLGSAEEGESRQQW